MRNSDDVEDNNDSRDESSSDSNYSDEEEARRGRVNKQRVNKKKPRDSTKSYRGKKHLDDFDTETGERDGSLEDDDEDNDSFSPNRARTVICCDMRHIHCIHVMVAIMLALLVACIVIMFFVDDKTKSYVYGIISLLLFILTLYACCYGCSRGKKSSSNTTTSIVNNYYRDRGQKRRRHSDNYRY